MHCARRARSSKRYRTRSPKVMISFVAAARNGDARERDQPTDSKVTLFAYTAASSIMRESTMTLASTARPPLELFPDRWELRMRSEDGSDVRIVVADCALMAIDLP